MFKLRNISQTESVLYVIVFDGIINYLMGENMFAFYATIAPDCGAGVKK
jgi:hypothetical protein